MIGVSPCLFPEPGRGSASSNLDPTRNRISAFRTSTATDIHVSGKPKLEFPSTRFQAPNSPPPKMHRAKAFAGHKASQRAECGLRLPRRLWPRYSRLWVSPLAPSFPCSSTPSFFGFPVHPFPVPPLHPFRFPPFSCGNCCRIRGQNTSWRVTIGLGTSRASAPVVSDTGGGWALPAWASHVLESHPQPMHNLSPTTRPSDPLCAVVMPTFVLPLSALGLLRVPRFSCASPPLLAAAAARLCCCRRAAASLSVLSPVVLLLGSFSSWWAPALGVCLSCCCGWCELVCGSL